MQLRKILNKNKKGQLAGISLLGGAIGPLIIGFLVILGIVAITILAILFHTHIYEIVGAGIVIMTIVFVLPITIKSNSQIGLGLSITLIIIGALLIAIPFISNALGFSLAGTNNFVKPSWARLECSPDDSPTSSLKYLDQQQEYNCGIDEFTEDCILIIKNTETGTFAQRSEGRYKILTGSNIWIDYSISRGESINIDMKAGDEILFDTGFFITNEDTTKITKEWKPWKLTRFVGGAKFILNANNCDIVSSARAKIVEDNLPSSNKLFRTGGIGTKWINYVDDWNFGPGTNVYNHPAEGEVYCTAGQIFKIIELEMADGNLRKIEPSYSQALPDGQVLNGLGSLIASVECCPNEPNCGSDFEFKTSDPGEEEDRDCFSDLQCFNSGNPVAQTGDSFTTFFCNSAGNCEESEPIEVDCTSNDQCEDGEICDLSTTNYGNCILQTGGSYCGDDVCDLIESSRNCPDDCGSSNAEAKCIVDGGNWKEGKTTTSRDFRNIISFGLFGEKTETTEPGKCLQPHISTFAVILIIIGIIFFIFTIITKLMLLIIPALILLVSGIIWSILAGIGLF